MAGADPPRRAVIEVLDHVPVVVGKDRLGPGVRPSRIPESGAKGRREPPRAAEQVPRDERLLAAPDEREQADPAAGGQLRELGGRAMRGCREDPLDGLRHRAQEVGERAVVEEAQDPVANHRGRVIRAGPGVLLVAGHGPLDLQALDGERGTVAQRQRQAERVGLDPATGQALVADGQPHHPAPHRHHLEVHLARHGVDQRPGSREEVRAVVHPVVAVGLGADPAPESV